MRKKGSHKQMMKLFGFLLAISIALVVGTYFAMNDGFEAARRKYFAVDGALIINSFNAIPDSAVVNYSYDLSGYRIWADDQFHVKDKDPPAYAPSGVQEKYEYHSYLDVNIDEPYDYFTKDTDIELSGDKKADRYSCPRVEYKEVLVNIKDEEVAQVKNYVDFFEDVYVITGELEESRVDNIDPDLILIVEEGERKVQFDERGEFACHFANALDVPAVPDRLEYPSVNITLGRKDMVVLGEIEER